DGLNQYLRAFALQELEHVEVAVAFGDLRPELADDLHYRLHLQAVDFDGVQLFADRSHGVFIGIAVKLLAQLEQRIHGHFPLLAFVFAALLRHPRRQVLVVLEWLALAQHGAERVHRTLPDLVRLALFHFIGTDAIDHLVHDVAEIERVEHAAAEIDGELQAGFAGGRLYAIVLLEQQHAKVPKPRVLQSQAILRLIHAEAARPARPGSEEDVIVTDLLLRHALRLEELQVLDEVADGEVRRVALPVVAVFLAQLEGIDVRHRQHVAVIAAALEDSLDHALVLPRQAAEQDRHLGAFFGAERALRRTLEVAHRAAIQAHHAGQPRALLRQLALNFFLALRTRQFINREVDARDRHSVYPLPRVDSNVGMSMGLRGALEKCDAGKVTVLRWQRRPMEIEVLTAFVDRCNENSVLRGGSVNRLPMDSPHALVGY